MTQYLVMAITPLDNVPITITTDYWESTLIASKVDVDRVIELASNILRVDLCGSNATRAEREQKLIACVVITIENGNPVRSEFFGRQNDDEEQTPIGPHAYDLGGEG